MMDLPQGADLAADRRRPGGAPEHFERSLLTLNVIVHAIDLGKAALPDDVQNLEAALEEVADGVVSRPGPNRGACRCPVRFRKRLAAGGRCRSQTFALRSGARAGRAARHSAS